MDSYDPSTGKFVPGNGGSLDKCRRRWDICDAEFLKYKFLHAYDRAMIHLEKVPGAVEGKMSMVVGPHCERGDDTSLL